jgi:hypothetical protein
VIDALRRLLGLPRIQDQSLGPVELASITCHHSQTMMKRRGGDNQVGLREGMPRLSAFLDEVPPPDQDVFRYLHHAPFKHGSDLQRQPIGQIRSACRIFDAVDTEPDFGKGHRTDIQPVEWAPGNKSQPLAGPVVGAAVQKGRWYRKATSECDGANGHRPSR